MVLNPFGVSDAVTMGTVDHVNELRHSGVQRHSTFTGIVPTLPRWRRSSSASPTMSAGAGCTVRWYDDGRVQTGQLYRVDGVPLVGSLVDVRVKGDDAYTATSGRNEFMSGRLAAAPCWC